MRGLALSFLVVLALPVRAAEAQRLEPSPFVSLDTLPAASELNSAAVVIRPVRHPAVLALGGVLGGAAGLVGGAYLGARATEHRCEDCFLVGGIFGAVAGASTGLPLGVHIANGGRGRLLPSLAASLAIGAAGFGAAVLTNTYEIMIPVPALQLISSILIERSTAARP
jgi:hypothetical protein